ncbi:hypothetical protein WJX74_008354 [Apatococcus lobatus]|uniref:glucose-1-phosphate adenylyltransferase n=2 Tax=Apatococcus TaxID=904362 RepID=A0AAW1SQ50_9CHLO
MKSFEGFRSVHARPSKALEATRPLSRPARAGRSSLQGCKALLGRDESSADHLSAIGSQDAAAKRHVACASTAMGGGLLEKTPVPTNGQQTMGPSARELKAAKERSRAKLVSSEDVTQNVHAVILAGGPSDNPMARYRAMPSMELGSNTQLIDVPISNCIRSGINKMYVLTQFNSHLLNAHVGRSYPPLVFGSPKTQGFVDVLACHQTPDYDSWYRGSADAVRRNLPVIMEPHRGAGLPEEVVILSGQALYRMDYRELLATHRQAGADVTIATHSVGWGQAKLRGLARVDPDTGLVTDFSEKPAGPQLQRMAHASKHATPDYPFEASMGVYVFTRDALTRLLTENEEHFGTDAGPDTHFGHDVMPHALRAGLRVGAHHFGGYWREISTLRDFFEVNLELASPTSPVSLFDVDDAIVSRGQMLPPAIMHRCQISNSLIGEGTVVQGSILSNSVLGCNAFIDNDCTIENSLIMGNDTYTNEPSRRRSREKGEAVLGIGSGTTIKNAIVDDNAAVGRNCMIANLEGVHEADRTQAGYVIHDGILLVLKGSVIADNSKI